MYIRKAVSTRLGDILRDIPSHRCIRGGRTYETSLWAVVRLTRRPDPVRPNHGDFAAAFGSKDPAGRPGQPVGLRGMQNKGAGSSGKRGGGTDARQPPTEPSPVEVEPPYPPVDVEDLPAEEDPRKDLPRTEGGAQQLSPRPLGDSGGKEDPYKPRETPHGSCGRPCSPWWSS